MFRAWVLATLGLVVPCAAAGQATSVLHVTVTLLDASKAPTPVPQHALLVSDNPATGGPRRIVTALDGTASIALRPGSYIVESDRPVAFAGKFYQWTQVVQIDAGSDATLALTAENAEDAEPSGDVEPREAAGGTDPSFLLPQWQDSVVTIWTRTLRVSATLVDARGLVATSQRVVGGDTSVEVQLSGHVKLAARVVASDVTRDTALLWIDAAAVAGIAPVPMGCGATKTAIAYGASVVTLGAPAHGPKVMRSGTVTYVGPRAFLANFRLPPGAAGGPVFASDGRFVGVTTIVKGSDLRGVDDVQVVRAEEVCESMHAAEQALSTGPAPSASALPVEPARPFPADALKAGVEQRVGSLSPYQTTVGDFEVSLVTPVLLRAAQRRLAPLPRRQGSRGGGPGGQPADPREEWLNPLANFANWADYVTDTKAVMLVRVTPKLVEGFWTTVARGAARTQGIALPPIKHFAPGFGGLRAYCGDTEVTPIHPFVLEQRLSDTDAVREGLYVFDPGALGPHCGTVKLTVFSEREPEKGETRVLDPKIVQQVWDDFAPYRAVAP